MEAFTKSSHEAGDFQSMAVTEYSELSYFRGLSLSELGEKQRAEQLFKDMKAFAEGQLEKEAKIDYFATSLPLMLVFEDDLSQTHQRTYHQLLNLAEEGMKALS